jgi:lycopene cyclase domain-containing protein
MQNLISLNVSNDLNIHNFEYLLVLLLSLFFPLIFTLFHPRAFFRKEVSVGLVSIFLISIPWIIWDILVTERGHWAFNYDYTIGPKLLGLPFEEWMFFWIIPFCCLFVWTIIRDFKTWDGFLKDMFCK